MENLVKLIDRLASEPQNIALVLAIVFCFGLWRQNENTTKAREKDREIVNDSLEKTTAALTAMTAMLHEVKTLILVSRDK